MRSKIFTNLIFLSFLSSFAYSQTVQVNHVTGNGQVSIPLWNLQSGNLNFPISISFETNSSYADLPTGVLGSGWRLNASGYITRSIRSLPDDYLDGTTPRAKVGWLKSSKAAQIQNFVPTSDLDPSTVNGERQEYDFLKSFGGFDETSNIYDTEPDLFYVNAPGLSASFFFDQNKQIKFIEKNNFKISYDTLTTGPMKGQIASFKIIGEDGTSYTFQNNQSVTYDATLINSDNYFLRTFYSMKSKPSGIANNPTKIKCYSSWKLVKMESTANDVILFSQAKSGPNVISLENEFSSGFMPSIKTASVDTFAIKAGENSFKNLYTLNSSWNERRNFSTINSKNQHIDFIYRQDVIGGGSYELYHEILNSIKIYDVQENGDKTLVRTFEFSYTYASGQDTNIRNYIFLKSVIERTATESLNPITFDYYGLTQLNQIATGNRLSNKKDEYQYRSGDNANSPGYFIYPELANANKYQLRSLSEYNGASVKIGNEQVDPNLSLLITGNLKQIVNREGGVTSIFYDAKKYKNTLTNQDEYGGGVNINRIIYHDGNSFSNDIVRLFDYTGPDGKSTGKLLAKPLKVFNLAHINSQGQDLFYHELIAQFGSEKEALKRLATYSKQPLNQGAVAEVLYEKVTERIVGNGSTTYYFNIPIEYGTSAIQGWQATQTRIAREIPQSSSSQNIVSVSPFAIPNNTYGVYAYPFAPNPEHLNLGELKKIEIKNEQGNLVTTEHYYYENVDGLPFYALSLDLAKAKIAYSAIQLPGSTSQNFETAVPMFSYAKYELRYDQIKRIKSKTIRNYDLLPSLNVSKDSIIYAYNTGFNTLSKTINFLSDGSSTETRYKYLHQLNLTGVAFTASDEPTKALLKMYEKNLLTIPIETYVVHVRPDSTKILQASLSEYQYEANADKVLLKKVYALDYPINFSGFNESSIVLNNSVYTFNKSPHYSNWKLKRNFSSYGAYLSEEDNDNNKSGLHVNKDKIPILTASFANADELVYSNFDDATDFNFSLESGLNTIEGRNQSTGINLTGNLKASGIIQLSTSSSLQLSFWYKNTSASTLKYRLNNQVNAIDVVLPSSGDKWKYYSLKLPVVSAGQNIIEVFSANTLAIDELLLKPAHAIVSTFSINKLGLKNSETNNEGLTTYFEYDSFFNVVSTKDFKGNIQSYATVKVEGANQNLPSIAITDMDGEAQSYIERNISYKIVNNGFGKGLTQATYKWKFLDKATYESNVAEINNFNSNVVVTTNNETTFTFPAVGLYLIQLEVTTIDGLKKTLIKPFIVDVKQQILKVSICSNRPTTIDLCVADTPKPLKCNGVTNGVNQSGLMLKANVTGGTGNNYSYYWSEKTYNSDSEIVETTFNTSSSVNITDYRQGEGTRTIILSVKDLSNPALDNEISTFYTFKTYKSNPGCNIIQQ